MKYNNALEYVNSFINFERIPKYQYATSFKLERMHAILDEIGNPQEGLKAIHVAGSKGKGSTCAITAYILREAGYKVGLYTSPHLVDLKERIRILDQKPETKSQQLDVFGGMIEEEGLSELIDEVRPVAEKYRDHRTLGKASFFEILTACAFLYFKKKQVDAVVLETGLGGRLDATNVILPKVCAITNISLEHTDKLGNSLGSIAFEKAGIIKGQGIAVSANQEKEVIDVIRKVCRERNTELYEVGKDIRYSIIDSGEKGQVFDLEGPVYSYRNLKLSLIGLHQVENASVAIGMLKLINKDFNIGEASIRQGLKEASWPGRLEIVKKNPYVILDGAQNPASILTLIISIKKLFRYKRLICVFGISSDKDIKGVTSLLDTFSDIIILTKARDNPRAEDVTRLRENFSGLRTSLEETSNIDDALKKALILADKNDLILITGSLFVVGDAMKSLTSR
jgi:dihydrofolate synthase/folylpolyglutamate synthase